MSTTSYWKCFGKKKKLENIEKRLEQKSADVNLKNCYLRVWKDDTAMKLSIEIISKNIKKCKRIIKLATSKKNNFQESIMGVDSKIWCKKLKILTEELEKKLNAFENCAPKVVYNN